jgi:ribosomal protein L16/L10AE
MVEIVSLKKFEKDVRETFRRAGVKLPLSRNKIPEDAATRKVSFKT